MILTTPLSYFASKNTTTGFQSDFYRIFNPDCLNRIYIMKGGPGTGKSSFMRDIAQFAKKNGITVEYFYCSSDPLSLDGIILTEPKIAIIDGTSPHTVDPYFPGIVENIINLGNFWDINKLSEHKKEIISIIKEKSKFYKRGYQFLAAYGEIAGEIFQLAKGFIDEQKMMENQNRLKDRIFTKNKNASETIRNIATFGAEGLIQTQSFEEQSENIYVIEDHFFSGHLFLNEFVKKAREFSQNFYFSTSPILNGYPNAIYFPNNKTCLILGERNYDLELPEKEYHYVNMKRFLDAEKTKENKQKIKFGYKCMAMLLEGAKEAFAEAKTHHKKLESYYIGAMDFDRLKEIKKEVENSVLTLIR